MEATTYRPTAGPQPGETPKQRVDRELAELLGEIRVALPGAELLLGFLLILPFTETFGELQGLGRAAYVSCFVITAAAIGLFIAPTAHHRLGFRDVDKEHLLLRSNRQIVGALGLVTVAVALAAYLVASVVLGDGWAPAVAAGLALWFGGWWFLVPLVANVRGRRDRGRHPPRPPARA